MRSSVRCRAVRGSRGTRLGLVAFGAFTTRGRIGHRVWTRLTGAMGGTGRTWRLMVLVCWSTGDQGIKLYGIAGCSTCCGCPESVTNQYTIGPDTPGKCYNYQISVTCDHECGACCGIPGFGGHQCAAGPCRANVVITRVDCTCPYPCDN
jgi:hypothetical protein